MDSPMHDARLENLSREEGFLHFLAREGRLFLRWTIGVCLIAIVVLMVSPGFFFVAVIPAVVLLVAYVLLVLANEVERRSDDAAHAALMRSEVAGPRDIIVEDQADAHQLHPQHAAVIKRESRIGIAIVGSVLLIALVIAFVKLPWPVVAIGALVVFCYILLVAAPLWLGWIEDDIEIEQHRLDDRPQPASVRTE